MPAIPIPLQRGQRLRCRQIRAVVPVSLWAGAIAVLALLAGLALGVGSPPLIEHVPLGPGGP